MTDPDLNVIAATLCCFGLLLFLALYRQTRMRRKAEREFRNLIDSILAKHKCIVRGPGTFIRLAPTRRGFTVTTSPDGKDWTKRGNRRVKA